MSELDTNLRNRHSKNCDEILSKISSYRLEEIAKKLISSFGNMYADDIFNLSLTFYNYKIKVFVGDSYVTFSTRNKHDYVFSFSLYDHKGNDSKKISEEPVIENVRDAHGNVLDKNLCINLSDYEIVYIPHAKDLSKNWQAEIDFQDIIVSKVIDFYKSKVTDLGYKDFDDFKSNYYDGF